MSKTQKYELYSQAFKANAYDVYAAMRAHAPVWQQPGMDGKTPIWFVTGYEEVAEILRDDKTFVRDPRNAFTAEEMATWPAPNPLVKLIDNHMLNKDGADHRRLRALVSKAFTPRIISELRPRIEEIAHELIDQVVDNGEMDLIDDFAFPLPITVIAELLGVPASDQDKFRVWSNAVITPALDADTQEDFMRQMGAFVAYLQQFFASRRQQPADDLVSALIAVEEAGDRLTEEELFSMVVLLIVAGHETTVNLIGNGVRALLQQRGKWEALQADPDRVPEAVEELLRYDGPVERALARWVATEVTLGGAELQRGDPIIAILGAADRDPAVFDQPDELDFIREKNPHLAFGRGVHYCLGAPLARLEGAVALRALLERLPGLAVAGDIAEAYLARVADDSRVGVGEGDLVIGNLVAFSSNQVRG